MRAAEPSHHSVLRRLLLVEAPTADVPAAPLTSAALAFAERTVGRLAAGGDDAVAVATPTPAYAAGAAVEVRGLKARAELNGRRATVRGWVAATACCVPGGPPIGPSAARAVWDVREENGVDRTTQPTLAA